MKKSIAGLGTCVVVGALGIFGQTVNAEAMTHTVQKGDTLWDVGHKYGVDYNKVREWSGLQSNVLHVGDKLVVSDPHTGGNTQTQVSSNGSYVVTADVLKVRSGAGTQFEQIGRLFEGNSLSVTGKEGEWYKINYDGKAGFVSSQFVSNSQSQNKGNNQPNQPNKPATTNPTATTGGKKGVVTADVLNVREGAGTQFGKVGRLTRGKNVIITGESGNWYQISFDKTSGFVSKDFVKIGVDVGNKETPNQVSKTSNYKINTTTLNVRESGTIASTILGKLHMGAVVTSTAEVNGWLEISFNGRKGFISKDFAIQTNESPKQGNVTSGNNGQTGTGQVSEPVSRNKQQMLEFSKKFLGMKYVWGGSNPSVGGMDCSGFIYYVLNQSGFSIGRTNVTGYWNSNRFTQVATPQAGDIVFFQGTYKAGPSHIGIMLNDHEFINAKEPTIAISDINSPYWKKHLLGFKRF
ncbi:C40 family peptidase [Bacillus cereus group sp. BfR-BA-02730]|uniref:C40 family peptidase n=1 Tax=Bacillus cereus group sp. BfR-BA-02730 TaxID=3094893 RepID=UPI0029C2FFF6|nr:SH3 domain-containing protein [Bacillus cereus group sp. BfR-BA-02730]MDX5808177.1 SH3 domain-containing protein [Bacillus cereus group sp. BfR-BA-02730]